MTKKYTDKFKKWWIQNLGTKYIQFFIYFDYFGIDPPILQILIYLIKAFHTRTQEEKDEEEE